MGRLERDNFLSGFYRPKLSIHANGVVRNVSVCKDLHKNIIGDAFDIVVAVSGYSRFVRYLVARK
jgi:hypothetical protein